MKWGVRRYQNKDGSLTAAGKKRIRTDLKENEVATKYKTRRDSDRKYVDLIEDTYEGKPEDYSLTKKERRKLDKAKFDFEQKNDDYYNTLKKITNNFVNKYGNKKISEVNEQYEKGRQAIDRLLEASKKDHEIWNDNIDTVRRQTAYEDLKYLQDLRYEKDIHKELDKLYKKEYGESVNTSRYGQNSTKRMEKRLEKRIKQNKKRGYYQ